MQFFLRTLVLLLLAAWAHVAAALVSVLLAFMMRAPEATVLPMVELELAQPPIEEVAPVDVDRAGNPAEGEAGRSGSGDRLVDSSGLGRPDPLGEVATLEVFRIVDEPARPLRIAKERDEERADLDAIAMSAGILALLDSTGPSPLGSATSDFGSVAALLGGELSDREGVGSAHGMGFGGLGSRGTGRGGGGDGGAIGLGGIGTVGRGGGLVTGGGLGVAYGSASLASVRFGTVSVQGTMKPSIASSTLRRATARLRRCYMHARETEPDLEGALTVSIVVDDNGSVSSVNVGADDPQQDRLELQSPSLRSCARSSIASLLFPPAEEPASSRVVTQVRFSSAQP